MQFVFAGVIVQAIVTLALLFSINRKGTHFLHYLNLYVIIILLDFVYEYYLLNHFKSNEMIYNIPGSFRILKGIVLLYAACIVTDRKWKKYIKYLLIPFGAIFILNFLSLLGIYNEWQNLQNIISFYSSILKYYIYYWIFILAIAIFVLLKYKAKKEEYILFQKPFLYFLVFILCTVLIYYSLHIFGFTLERIQHIYSYIFLVHFAWILFINFLNIKRNGEQKILLKEQNSEAEIIKKPKYDNINIEKTEYEDLSEKIEKLYAESDAYLQEDFSLDRLSDVLSINKNKLTMTFNNYMETNFHEFTNKKRVERFKKIFEKNPELNIIDTAYQCGFKSKSTFYKYFKQEFGISPTEYKTSMKN